MSLLIYNLFFKCFFFLQMTLFSYSLLVSFDDTFVHVTHPLVPVEQMLIFRADQPADIWRFVTYALVHTG
jgi:hypothetical protein